MCFWVMTEGETNPSGWVNLTDMVVDVHVCVDLGKLSVRCAALMCRNAEIP